MSQSVPDEILLVACDIDDTLLPFGKDRVSAANMDAIRRTRRKGVKFILATGRHYATARTRIDEVNEGDLPVIAANGAEIRVGGRAVHVSAMDDSVVEEITRELIARGVPRYLFCGDDILCLEEDNNPEVFALWNRDAAGEDPVRILGSLDELLKAARGRTQKMLAFVHTQEEHDELLPAMLERFGDAADITCGGGLNLEINAPDVSKGAALQTVCDMLGVSISQTMAIGDSGNDTQMLEAAGLGVAVGNAMQEAKDAADAVVETSDEDGVARALERFVLRTAEEPLT